MWLFGAILIILALPLFIGHFLSDKKNPMRIRLGTLLLIVGILIIIAGSIARM